MSTEAKARAKREYRKTLKRLTIDFYPRDMHLWNHIESQPQKQTYIKNLIREDIDTRVCPTCETTWHNRETICPNCGTKIPKE